MSEAPPTDSRWRRVRRVLALAAGWALVVAIGLSEPAIHHARAAGLLLRFESGEPAGEHEGIADVGRHAVQEAEATFEGALGRVYRPVGLERPPGVVLVHGVHHRGVDEPRLRTFARAVSSAGITVLTPAMPGLSGFEIEPASVERIGRAARHHAEELDVDTVGVIGISFSGGLSLIAAAEAEERAFIGWVASIGGHHQLARVARFWVGERVDDPSGEPAPAEPHPYGAAVVVYSLADEFFSADDVPAAREAVRTVLEDRGTEARSHLPNLSTEGQATLRAVLDRDRSLVPRYLEVVEERAEHLARVSPSGRLGALDVPALLVHGAADPIVPSTETRWLARDVPTEHLHAELVTEALRHAEYDEAEPTLTERWEMVGFVAAVLEQASR